MVAKATNLYAAITQSGSIARLGEVTVLRMDGAGAIAVSTFNFNAAARWAQRKPASGSLQKDRMQFLDRFETFLARTASMVQTRGSATELYNLLKAMQRVDADIHEWSIPHSLEELLKEAAAAKEEAKKVPEGQENPPNQDPGQK